MATTRRIKRRTMLKATAAAGAAFHILPSGVLARPGQPGASDRIVLGHIGVGGMGGGHLGRGLSFQQLGTTRVAAVCDVDSTRLAAAVKRCGEAETTVEGYGDYRRLLRAPGHRCGDHCHAGPLARRADRAGL